MKLRNFYFLIFYIFLFYGISQASNCDFMEIERDDFRALGIHKIPSEIVIQIGEYLRGEDFQTFALTSKNIREILITHKPFFIPENKEETIATIKKTPFNQISYLYLKWERTPRQFYIIQLRSILEEWKYYDRLTRGLSKELLKSLHENVQNYVKTLNLLYFKGDKSAFDIAKQVYHKEKMGLETTMQYTSVDQFDILDVNLYKFHLRNMALLSPKVRRSLAARYLEGSYPFKKNFEKSATNSKPLKLPLEF